MRARPAQRGYPVHARHPRQMSRTVDVSGRSAPEVTEVDVLAASPLDARPAISWTYGSSHQIPSAMVGQGIRRR